MEIKKINKKLISEKIRMIDEYFSIMREIIQNYSVKEIKNNPKDLHSVEREFQMIVDTMVDINSHIISRKVLPAAEDFQSTFEILGRNKILSLDFALKIAPIVGLRNRIVHKYEKLDIEKFLNDLKTKSDNFAEYIKQINKFLKKVK